MISLRCGDNLRVCWALVPALAALLVAGGCASESTDNATSSKAQPLVVYVSADGAIARTVLDAFTADTGIQVHMVGDTEAFKSTGLARRIVAECDRPVADVFWSSETAQVAKLAHAGLLEPVHIQITEAWPEQWRDSDHRWHGFSPRPRVAVWDPDRIGDVPPPTTWHEAIDGRFGNAVVMADPRFGTTGGHLASMRQWWCAGGQSNRWDSFLQRLRDGRVQVLPGGNAATVDAVIRGEALLGMTDLDDALAAQRRGSTIEIGLLRHDDVAAGGAMLTPNAVARIRGGPQGDDSIRLIEWLLSARCATLLAASDSANMPLQPDVQANFPSLVVDDHLGVDHTAAALQLDVALAEVLDALRAAREAS